MKVNELTITIDNFDNAAMVDDGNAEVSQILRQIADRIDDGGIVSACDGLRLMDSNGNQVGGVDVDWEEEAEVPDDCEEVSGHYGSGHTECTVFVHVQSGWYCVEGSCNVNQTDSPELLVDGVDVEELGDVDCFTSSDINTLDEFARAISDVI